jgi:ribosomal protein S27E
MFFFACLGVLLICTMCMDNLIYGSGGKKVVNNEMERIEIF